MDWRDFAGRWLELRPRNFHRLAVSWELGLHIWNSGWKWNVPKIERSKMEYMTRVCQTDMRF